MSAYSRDKEAAPTDTPIYRELYYKHGIGSLLGDAYAEEWEKGRAVVRDGAVPWAAIVGIAAMLDVNPHRITDLEVRPRKLTVSYMVHDDLDGWSMVTDDRAIMAPGRL